MFQDLNPEPWILSFIGGIRLRILVLELKARRLSDTISYDQL